MGTVTLGEALKKIEAIANEKYDGHYSILKFTTGYKVFFGTATMDYDADYQKVLQLPSFDNITVGIVNAVINEYEV